MLEFTKSIKLTGYAKMEDKQVVYLSADISTNGNSGNNISTVIQDKDVYYQNREAIREDIAAFQQKVYKVQDELATAQEV